MLKKFNELSSKFENHIKFAKNENKSFLEEAKTCIALHQSTSLEMAKIENKIFAIPFVNLDEYFKNSKAKFLSYYFYYDTIIDCENFKLKNNFCNWKIYFNLEKEKIENFKKQFSEFLPILTPCFDEIIFNRDICSKGFKSNLWESLNKLTANHDIILAYLLAINITEHYLFEQIKKIDFIENSNQDSLFEWHGKPVTFVEVKLSLIISNYLKNDQLSEFQFLQKLAYFYKVELTNPYKTVGEIKSRKGPKPKVIIQLQFDFEKVI